MLTRVEIQKQRTVLDKVQQTLWRKFEELQTQCRHEKVTVNNFMDADDWDETCVDCGLNGCYIDVER